MLGFHREHGCFSRSGAFDRTSPAVGAGGAVRGRLRVTTCGPSHPQRRANSVVPPRARDALAVAAVVCCAPRPRQRAPDEVAAEAACPPPRPQALVGADSTSGVLVVVSAILSSRTIGRVRHRPPYHKWRPGGCFPPVIALLHLRSPSGAGRRHEHRPRGPAAVAGAGV